MDRTDRPSRAQGNTQCVDRFSRWLNERGSPDSDIHTFNAGRLADWALQVAEKDLSDLNGSEIMRFMYRDYILDTDGSGRQVSLLPESLEIFSRYLKVVEGLRENPAMFMVCRDSARYRRRLESFRSLDPEREDYEEQKRLWEGELEEWIGEWEGDIDPGKTSLGSSQRIETATVLFACLQGFLERTASQPLEQIAQELEEFYRECGDVLFSAGGEVARFVGDGVLAYFSVGQTCKAILSAQNLSEKVESWKLRWNVKQLGFGVGIHTGEVMIGSFGHPARKGLDILGHPVALAALLARRGSLFVSRTALDACKEPIATLNRSAVEVRWAQQLLHAYELDPITSKK